MSWVVEEADAFANHFRRFHKRYPHECMAMLANLETYLKALQEGIKPMQFKAGFIHPEQAGVKALDQKGSEIKKPAQTRLYVYAEEERKILHLITVGDKTDQNADVNLAKRYVEKLRGGAKS